MKGHSLWQGIISCWPQEQKGDVKPKVIVSPSPIAQRTRGRLKEKEQQKENEQKIRRMQLETPTKTSTAKDADVSGESDSDDSESADSVRTSFESIPDELKDLFYPPTEDEQIVNAALVLFLNALTIHFHLSNA